MPGHIRISYIFNMYICTCILDDMFFFKGPPSPITSTTATDTSCLTNSTIVSWTPSSGDPVCGPISYSVTISPSNGVIIMMINDTSYNFTALTPGTNYIVTVAAINMAGVGEANTVMFYIVTMTEAVPSGEFKFSINNYMYLLLSTKPVYMVI